MYNFALIFSFFASLLLTPFVRRLALNIGATDKPNHRKVHKNVMPRLGGLGIFISFTIGIIIAGLSGGPTFYILLGGCIIAITGILDDMLELSAKYKLLGQAVAAGIVIFGGGIQMHFVSLPFGLQWNFHFMSIPITFLWIIGITNSMNLIDGLDGLATGVSSIALLAISGMALIAGDSYVAAIGFILLASALGFLVHNFHPAKIFLGDTGSLYLGFIISVVSLLGFKNVTFISLIIPVIILGVPISDTFFAIIRRVSDNKPLSSPDKFHLHHCLLYLGLSHRQTVLVIYSMAVFFGIVGVLMTKANLKGIYVFIVMIILIIELFAEKIGWVGKEFRPLTTVLRFLYPPLAKGK